MLVIGLLVAGMGWVIWNHIASQSEDHEIKTVVNKGNHELVTTVCGPPIGCCCSPDGYWLNQDGKPVQMRGKPDGVWIPCTRADQDCPRAFPPLDRWTREFPTSAENMELR